MIQILGFRKYNDPKTGKDKTGESFFKKGFRAASVPDLLDDHKNWLRKIPKQERYNIFYTLADCEEKTGRHMVRQTTYIFDIDGIDANKIDEYLAPIFFVLKVPADECGVVFTGHGLHILIESDLAATDKGYFGRTRAAYKDVCRKIDAELKKVNLEGFADQQVWKAGVMSRLPGTLNKKDGQEELEVKVINSKMRVQNGWNISELSGASFEDTKAPVPATLKRYPKVDSNAVIEGCEFLKHCKSDPAYIKESSWYKMLSIVSRLEGGKDLCHEYSKGHPSYDMDECENKIEQALNASGPRTCANISEDFDCTGCKHQGLVTSPILIKGEDFISTEETGFYNVSYGASGNIKYGRPNYDDLVKHFSNIHNFVCTPSKLVYIWKDTHWRLESDSYLDHFCEEYMTPKPTAMICNEFRAKIYRNNLQDDSWFNDTTFKKLNLKNGTLNLSGDTPILEEHSKDNGFLHVLPYKYDQEASCPRFDRFMREVSLNQKQIINVLMEYAGYAFANEECTAAKALILLGDGANGKSTFMDVLKMLAGSSAYSSVTLNKLDNDQYAARLCGKLFNLTEETPKKAFYESNVFKNIVSGGDITVKIVYKAPYEIKNRAKLILCCNEMPPTDDMSDGMLRRLMIVPFNNRFDNGNQDIHIKKKIEKELSGVLNRIVEGYYRFRKQERFSNCDAVNNEIEEYKKSIDPINGFMDLHVRVYNLNDDKNVSTTTKAMYNAFQKYCVSEGISPHKTMTCNVFTRGLKRYVDDIKERKSRQCRDGQTIITFKNIEVNEGGF